MELFQQIVLHARELQTTLIKDSSNRTLRNQLDMNRLIRSEVERIDRSPSDEQTLGVLVKMRKVAAENLELLNKELHTEAEAAMVQSNQEMIEYLDRFLPARLDDEEALYAAIEKFMQEEIAANPEFENRPANAWKGAASKAFRGRADGKMIASTVDKIAAK